MPDSSWRGRCSVLLLPLIYGGLPAVGSAALAPAWASLRQPLRHRRVAPLAAKLQHPSPKPIRRVKANSAARRTKARRPLGRGEGALAAAEVWRRRGEGFLRNFIPALGLFLWVRTCVVEPFFIPSQSMAPTLSPNDQIAVEKFSRLYALPKRGELVVFRPPAAYFAAKGAEERPGTRLIKRVIAVGGDTVEVRAGVLYLNGAPRYEPYALEAPTYSLPLTTVPAGAIFVLGDNRNVSVDSHVWGSLPIENIIGKAFYVLYPVDRQGFVDQFMQDLKLTGDTGAFIERLVPDIDPPPTSRPAGWSNRPR